MGASLAIQQKLGSSLELGIPQGFKHLWGFGDLQDLEIPQAAGNLSGICASPGIWGSPGTGDPARS